MKHPRRGTIGDSESKVRDLINHRVGGYDAFPLPTWLRICAAMDAVGDTSIILDNKQLRRLRGGYAAQYLRLYGLLQAVHAQQDSIEFLWKTIVDKRHSPAKDSAWTQLRIWRNALVAHSAKVGGAIGRITMRGQAPLVARLSTSERGLETTRLPLGDLLDRYVVEARQSLDKLAQVICERYSAREAGEA